MSAALTVLSLLKLPKDDVPPKEIWGHSERLIDWLNALEAKHARPDGHESIDDNDETPDGTMFQRNELVDELLGRNKK